MKKKELFFFPALFSGPFSQPHPEFLGLPWGEPGAFIGPERAHRGAIWANLGAILGHLGLRPPHREIPLETSANRATCCRSVPETYSGAFAELINKASIGWGV